MENVTDLSMHSSFRANTGDEHNLVEILRLGAAQYDMGVLHDTDGQPLTRTAATGTPVSSSAWYSSQPRGGAPALTTPLQRSTATPTTCGPGNTVGRQTWRT